MFTYSRPRRIAPRSACGWPLREKRDELGIQVGDDGPPARPWAKGANVGWGSFATASRCSSGRVSSGPGAGASVRTSLPVPHEGRPAPTASA